MSLYLRTNSASSTIIFFLFVHILHLMSILHNKTFLNINNGLFHYFKCYRFDKARDRISAKYDQVEKDLIVEFRSAHQMGDKRRMKRFASVLSQFKVNSPYFTLLKCEINVHFLTFFTPQILIYHLNIYKQKTSTGNVCFFII